jgi:hypothetical protein
MTNSGILTASYTIASQQPGDITYTVVQTGGEDNAVDSTGIVFTFSASVDGLNLTAADITVGGTATKGANATLTGTGTTRTLPITVTHVGQATVSIAKSGIIAETKHVTVYKAGEAAPALTGITAAYTQGSAIVYPATPVDNLKAGLVVKAQFSNEEEETLSAGEYTLSGELTAGTSTVTVTYTHDGVTKTAIFTVNVTAAPAFKTLSGITLNTASVKEDYSKGEQLDLTDLVVTANYSDGSSAEAPTYTADPANGTTLSTSGSITVTISYTEGGVTKTANFNVFVSLLSLSGDITIIPDSAIIGAELTANYSGSESVTLVYQWKKDGENVGTNSNKYTATEPGNYTVTVSADGYSSKTSNPVTVSGLIIIENAEIHITAPANGETPDTTATGTGDFTIGAVSWSPNHSTFQGSTVYTVTVTLTADSGHTFTGLSHPTVNGETATVPTNTGTAVTLSYTFAATLAKAVTGIAITTQPSTLTYTHGDTLNLTGLVVKLTYDDASTEDVAFTGFTSHNIDANPSHGDHLVRSTHNNKGVTVTYGHFHQDTSSLNVYQKSISASGITVDAIAAQTYTGSPLTPAVTVRDGTTVLVLDTDYTVSYNYNTNAGTSASVTITGTGNYNNSRNANFTINKAAGANVSGAPTVNGTPTTTSITVNTVTLSTATGQSIEYGINTTNTAPTGSTATNKWQENNTTFSGLTAATPYYFFARAKESANYNTGTASSGRSITTAKNVGVVPAAPTATSANITANSVTLTAVTVSSGQTVEYARNGSNTAPTTGWQTTTAFTGLSAATQYYFFARAQESSTHNASAASSGTAITTLAVVSAAAIPGVTAPVTGATPVTAITETAQYTGTVAWNGSPSAFAANVTYTATITLTAKTGYTFTGVAANFFTVAGATTVANSAGSGATATVTAAFPATVSLPYIITANGTSTTQFTARQGSTIIGTANSSIANVLTAIRTDANGEDVTIQFGNGSATLDIGTGYVEFATATPAWGNVNLTGSVTSTVASTANVGTITTQNYTNTPPSITSTADIFNKGNNATNSRAIRHGGYGTFTISGGTVSADNADTIHLFSDGKLDITGGTVSSTGGANTIRSSNWGIINITGGTVKQTNSATTARTILIESAANYNDNYGIVNISSGEVSITNGTAISYTGAGKINISGGTVSATGEDGQAVSSSGSGEGEVNISGTALVTSVKRSTSSSGGTINIATGVLNISGGRVENTYNGPTSHSPAVYDNSRFNSNITGGTISSVNNAVYYVYNGGTVYIEGNSRFISSNPTNYNNTIYIHSFYNAVFGVLMRNGDPEIHGRICFAFTYENNTSSRVQVDASSLTLSPGRIYRIGYITLPAVGSIIVRNGGSLLSNFQLVNNTGTVLTLAASSGHLVRQ